MKVVRCFVVFKKVIRELQRVMRPQSVASIKLGREHLQESVVTNITVFFVIFVAMFAAASVVMTCLLCTSRRLLLLRILLFGSEKEISGVAPCSKSKLSSKVATLTALKHEIRIEYKKTAKRFALEIRNTLIS